MRFHKGRHFYSARRSLQTERRREISGLGGHSKGSNSVPAQEKVSKEARRSAMRILIISLLTVSFSFSITVIVLAHCGSTWTTQAPTFGPTLGTNGCTVNSNPTVTTKSVATTIFWTVGSPISHTETITRARIKRSTAHWNQLPRCFPEFETPQWTEPSAGVTRWSQLTYKVFVTSADTCAVDGARGSLITTGSEVALLEEVVMMGVARSA